MTVSTVNPNVPAFQSPGASAAVRNNFRAAYNDITALWSAVQSGQAVILREVTDAGDIEVLPTDSGIAVENNSSSSVNVNLLSAADGRYIVIKDALGYAGTNYITVIPDGTETIDGASSYVIGSSYGAVTLAPITGGWSILA